MYKTILVQVDADDPGVGDRILCAAALARDHRATLVGAAVGLPEAALEVVASGTPIFAGGFVTSDEDQLKGRFALARAEFTRWTADLNIATDWRTAVDFPADALARMASIADLIVVGSPVGSTLRSPYRGVDCGDLVMRAGRPVLTLPHGLTRLDLTGAIVAWKNTREARRVLSDALPLLAKAEAVTLLHVRERGEKDDGSLAEAKTFLDRHSIKAATQTADAENGEVADRIVGLARQSRSGLIVAGAYGHSRFREWVLGGVTQDLLHACPLACVLGR